MKSFRQNIGVGWKDIRVDRVNEDSSVCVGGGV